MKIAGLQKLSLLDYPGYVSCIIFTKSCNFKCPFCHNSSLIEDNDEGLIKEEEIFEFLNKRKNTIDGVSITGGEPLLQKDIIPFIIKIKDMGFKVKVDTNGSIPTVLKQLVEDKLVDYIAMDIKNTFEKYDITTDSKVNINNIKESINIIENSGIDYEFRTTVVKEYHSIEDIKSILSYIKSDSTYYIQNFNNNDQVLNRKLNKIQEEDLKNMKRDLETKYQNIHFRDV